MRGRRRWGADGLVGGDVGPWFGVVAGLGGGLGLEDVSRLREVTDLVVSRARWGWFGYLRNRRNLRNLVVAGDRCWRAGRLVDLRSRSRRLYSLAYAAVAVRPQLSVALGVGQTGKKLRSSFLRHLGRELLKQARIVLQFLGREMSAIYLASLTPELFSSGSCTLSRRYRRMLDPVDEFSIGPVC